MAIELKRGIRNPQGSTPTTKDGEPWWPYVKAHPTNYIWVPRVERLAHKLVNMDEFIRQIWVNTYRHHPPATPKPRLSLDIWAWLGRGAWLPKGVGDRARNKLFFDPDPPDVWWHLANGVLWQRDAQTFQVKTFPLRQDDLDNAHIGHKHFTYFSASVQERFRRSLNMRSVWVPESVSEAESVVPTGPPLTREDVAEVLAEQAAKLSEEDYADDETGDENE